VVADDPASLSVPHREPKDAWCRGRGGWDKRSADSAGRRAADDPARHKQRLRRGESKTPGAALRIAEDVGSIKWRQPGVREQTTASGATGAKTKDASRTR
jgi:hypothetical protein